jgi:hypothetical protein
MQGHPVLLEVRVALDEGELFGEQGRLLQVGEQFLEQQVGGRPD